MKTKSNVFGAVLLCCTLVLAFTACAGCTSGPDPIVGTWVNSFSNKGGIIVNDFHEDGTFDTYVVYADGYAEKQEPFSWKKTGNNRYESGLVIYKISNDGYTLTETMSSGTEYEYTKYSNYKIPAVTSKDSTLYKEHQVVDTWKFGDSSNYIKITLDSDKTGTFTVRSTKSGLSTYQITWKYYDTTNGIDRYTLTSNLGNTIGAIGHKDSADTITFAATGVDTVSTLTRV